MNKYKMRAECALDVVRFVEQYYTKLESFSMKRLDLFPDVELEFETEMTLVEIIHELKKLDDSHVMFQTANHTLRYTGERDYDRQLSFYS